VEQAAATAQALVDRTDVLNDAVRLFTIAGREESSHAMKIASDRRISART